MLEITKMNRLNELANKKKVSPLTEPELTEQKELRQEYLSIFRTGMRETILNTKVIDPKGNDVTPDIVKAIRQNKVLTSTVGG